MKILFVLGQIPTKPFLDGGARWFYNTIKAIHPLVKQIHVAGQSNEPKEIFSDLSKYCDQIFIVPPINHGKYRYKILQGWDSGRIRAYNPGIIKLLKYLCIENFYDLIFLVGHGTHVYVPYIKGKHVMAALLDAPSGVIGPTSTSWDLSTFLNKLVIKQSERSYNCTDSVLVVSSKDKEILIKAGVTTPIIINPLSVDTTEFFPWKIKAQTKNILFTGNLNFQPNIDAAIHLVNDIFDKGEFYNKGINCRIAGRRITQAVKDLARFNGVEIFEDLPDLRPLMNDALIYVAPMQTGLGMKTKILEAMAMGKPIIGYPLTYNGIKDPEQFAIVCQSPQEFIEAINKLNHDVCLRNYMGEKARKFAEDNYSLEQNITLILDQVKLISDSHI